MSKKRVKKRHYRALAVRFASLRRYVRALEKLGMCIANAYASFGKRHLGDCDTLIDIHENKEEVRPCSCGIEEVELKIIELQTAYNRRIVDGRSAFKAKVMSRRR